SAVLLVMMLANRLVLTVFFVAQPNLGLDVVLTIVTAAVYPAVVFVSTYALGVQKLAPGAPDTKRRST
ncbi:MAG: rod shape-determining protein MreD, partial [Paracoccaceae bacterium]